MYDSNTGETVMVNNKDKVVTFRCENKLLNHLRGLTHKLSLERGEELSCSQLIRDALYRVYFDGGDDGRP